MKQNLKIIFIGWNENGEKCLQALLKKGYKFEQVIIPAGYDTQKMSDIAAAYAINVYEYKNDLAKLESLVRHLNPDLIIVASFPKLLPPAILQLPKYGVINVHTGELPKYRGFHPLNWALIRDEPQIGVTVHYMDDGMDSGNILAQASVKVTNRDDILTIKQKTTTLGARLLAKVVGQLVKNNGQLRGQEQRDSQVLFAPKRGPADGKVKWSNHSRDVFNLVRALKSPYPNAYATTTAGQRVEFQQSYMPSQAGLVLAKIDGHYLITTGDGVIMLKSTTNLKIGSRLS